MALHVSLFHSQKLNMAFLENDAFNSDYSSDFFSPTGVNNRQEVKTFADEIISPPSPSGDDDGLPTLHDSSWIGARMSPIHSFDKEGGDTDDGDDDERLTSVYRRALHDSMEAASMVDEKSSLLGKKNRAIHPLWDPLDKNRENMGIGVVKSYWKALRDPSTFAWGNFICFISGMYLVVMACFDMYFQHSWTIPWMIPPSSTLVRFGGFATESVLHRGQYWRFVTSSVMTTSFAEWILMVAAWRLVLSRSSSPPWHRWAGPFLWSSFTGQMWMMAWDHTENSVAGSAIWGTCGVLCCSGMLRPSKRFQLFLVAIATVILVLLERPYNSVWGALGSSFFGWSFATAWMMPRIIPASLIKQGGRGADETIFRWLSWVAAVSMWVVPGLWIALKL